MYRVVEEIISEYGRRPSHWAPEVACSAAILACIFLRAARIISSRRRCRAAWRSSRLLLQPLPLLSSLALVSESTLSLRLYRVMRSGCEGLSACRVEAALWAEALWPGGGGGWKVTGGYQGQQTVVR